MFGCFLQHRHQVSTFLQYSIYTRQSRKAIKKVKKKQKNVFPSATAHRAVISPVHQADFPTCAGAVVKRSRGGLVKWLTLRAVGKSRIMKSALYTARTRAGSHLLVLPTRGYRLCRYAAPPMAAPRYEYAACCRRLKVPRAKRPPRLTFLRVPTGTADSSAEWSCNAAKLRECDIKNTEPSRWNN